MKNYGGYPTINAYVRAKIKRLRASEKTFASLYEMMFSERENILAEKLEGHRIRRKTYGESRDDCDRFAKKLRAASKKVERGAMVGLYMQNSVEWIESLWAILHCGYVPLLLNTRMEKERIEGVLEEYRVPLVLSDGETFPCETLLYADVAASEEEDADMVWADELIVMSSGTSENVKLCVYSGESFAAQIEDSARIISRCKQIKKGYRGEHRLLAFLPLYHIFGLSAMYMWFGFFSRTFVFLNDYSPETIQSTIRRHKVTHIFAVPLFWDKTYNTFRRKLAERGEQTVKKFERGLSLSTKLGSRLFAKLALREVRDNLFGESIRFMITGGGPVSPEVLAFFNGIGYPLANGYGMSEVGITSVEISPRPKDRNLGAIGSPFAHVEYKIGEGDELLVRGSSVAHKILCAGETYSPFGTWFHTKDLAKLENGRYFLLGRKDDMLVGANGENINPDRVEGSMSVEGALGLCLVGVKKGAETVPTLVVQVDPFSSAEKLAAVREGAQAELTRLALAGSVQIVLTGVPPIGENDFKVNRRRLAERLLRGELETFGGRGGSRAGDELSRKIRAMFADALGKKEEDIGDDMHFFFDLGGSSLDYFAMVSDIHDVYPVDFPTAPEDCPCTVRQFCDYIKERS